MTTEREYQEGQDRIRRSQGRSEYLRGRKRRNDGSAFGSQRRPPANRLGDSRRSFVWVIGAVVLATLALKVVPRLLAPADAPANRVEQRR